MDSFQTKVGVLGNVSVGKTTFLNALFQDQFGTVSERRCTAGIHHYHVKKVIKKPEEKKTFLQTVLNQLDITLGLCEYEKSSSCEYRSMRRSGWGAGVSWFSGVRIFVSWLDYNLNSFSFCAIHDRLAPFSHQRPKKIDQLLKSMRW